MVLVIDTSSVRAALALVATDREVVGEHVQDSGRDLDLAGIVEAMVNVAELTAVAVALGPGSFTGLRVGVAYAVGLAMGRGIPLLGLDSLALCRARARVDSRGLVEAGRGRVYHAAAGEEARLDEAAAVPRDLPGAGWLRPATVESLTAAGVRVAGEGELRAFGEAAASQLAGAPELDYGRVKLRYMQSFGAPT